jgi:hypothetical protein
MELTGNIRWRGLQRVGHVIRVMDERVPEKSLNGYIRREKSSWKVRREMFGCSGQGW